MQTKDLSTPRRRGRIAAVFASIGVATLMAGMLITATAGAAGATTSPSPSPTETDLPAVSPGIDSVNYIDECEEYGAINVASSRGINYTIDRDTWGGSRDDLFLDIEGVVTVTAILKPGFQWGPLPEGWTAQNGTATITIDLGSYFPCETETPTPTATVTPTPTTTPTVTPTETTTPTETVTVTPTVAPSETEVPTPTTTAAAVPTAVDAGLRGPFGSAGSSSGLLMPGLVTGGLLLLLALGTLMRRHRGAHEA